MKVNLKCLTPIWTGDIDSKSNTLKSTGLMGSLRWWTESILRGMGKFACDPSSENRCPKEKNEHVKSYCTACLIFGATGLRRLFRMEVTGGENLFESRSINIRPEGRDRGWYLGSGIVGTLTLKVVPLDSKFTENLVLLPLAIASKWGGIGAKTQHGYGVVEIIETSEINFNCFQEALKEIENGERLSQMGINLRSEESNLPNLKEMFFSKIQFEVNSQDWWKEVDGIKGTLINDKRMITWTNSGSVPIAPAIKNWLRFGEGKNLWKTSDSNRDRQIENWLFGTTKSERIASKINISCAYKINNNLWEFRIWGWIPKLKNNLGFDREKFLDNLKNSLKNFLKGKGPNILPCNKPLEDVTKNQNHRPLIWREFNSDRDIEGKLDNIDAFIESLLR